MKLINFYKSLVKKYGRQVSVTGTQGCFYTKAFIQPLRYKNKMYLDFEVSELGTVDDSSYLYIGPDDIPLEYKNHQSVVRYKETSYTVARSETVYIGDESVYIWAILNPLIEEGEYV